MNSAEFIIQFLPTPPDLKVKNVFYTVDLKIDPAPSGGQRERGRFLSVDYHGSYYKLSQKCSLTQYLSRLRGRSRFGGSPVRLESKSSKNKVYDCGFDSSPASILDHIPIFETACRACPEISLFPTLGLVKKIPASGRQVFEISDISLR